MAIRYRNSPLVEAIFEFSPLRANLAPDAAESLRQELSPRYAGKTDQQDIRAIQVHLTRQNTTATQLRAPPRRRMWTSDGRALVQFAQDICVFNALAPYSHYVDYLPDIEDLFTRYSSAAHPDGTRFLGHRYINRIHLPDGAVPRDYFTVYPSIPKEMPAQPHPPFAMNLQTETISSGQVVMTLAFQRIEAAKPIYLLDLYARTADSPAIGFNWPEIRAWQDEAHAAVKRGFEFAITDSCREFLGVENES